MEESLNDDLRTWSMSEIREAILNDTLNDTQKEYAKNLLTRFSYLPKGIRVELEEALENLDESEPGKRLLLLAKAYQKAEELTQKEFKKALGTIKHLLKKDGLILPRDWKEVFVKWYLKKQDIESYLKSIYDLPVNDRKLIFDWAEEYSKDILNKKDESKEIPERIHSQKTRIDLEPKYRFYLMEKLEMIDQKGIFYDTNLSLNERAKLLSKILGYNERECKDLLNGKTHFNEEKKSDLDDFLNDLIKKRKK